MNQLTKYGPKVISWICVILIASGAGYFESASSAQGFGWNPITIAVYSVLLGRLYLLAISGALFDDVEWKGYIGFTMSALLTIGISVYGFSLEGHAGNHILLYQVVNWTLFFVEVALGISRIKSIDHQTVIEANRLEIDNLLSDKKGDRELIDSNRKQIDKLISEQKADRFELGQLRKRIGSLESEQKADRLQIENQKSKIEANRLALEKASEAIGIVSDLRKGKSMGSAGIVWLCDKNNYHTKGNRAKDKSLVCECE